MCIGGVLPRVQTFELVLYYLNSFLKIIKFIPTHHLLNISLKKVFYPLFRDIYTG